MNNLIKKYITIILGIYFFWLGIVPWACSSMLSVVAENISYNSDYNIELEKPKLCTSILPVLTLKAEDIKISLKKTDDNMHLIKPSVRIRILPLFSGHVHINKISASEIDINSKLLTKPQLDKDFFKELKKEKFIFDAVKIGKIKTVLKRQEGNITCLGSDIYYRKNGRFIKVNVNSDIISKSDKSTINIKLYLPQNNDIKKSEADINVQNLDIKPIANFLKNYLPKDLVSASGVIDIKTDKNHLESVFRNCAVVMKDEAKSIIFPEILKISSNFSLTGKSVNIESAELSSERISANISGTISNYLEKAFPAVNLDIRVNKSRIEDFIAMLPAFATEDIDVYKLKKYKFYGDCIGNLNITGDNAEPSLTGDIFINNGVLTKPIPNAKGATVKIKLLGKYLTYDVTVPAGGVEKVWVKGGVELYNVKYADMRVWSTQHVDLATAEEKVVPLHEILNFVIGPVPLMDIHGDGNIDITVKGNRKNPHVWGGLNFRNVETFFNDIPNLVLKNAEAVLKFDDENAVFNLTKGQANGKKINIDGTCNLSGKFDFDVHSEHQELGSLYNALKTSGALISDIRYILPNLDVAEGLVNLKLKVYGNLKYIELAKFNENFFTKGEIILLGNKAGMNGVAVTNAKGNLNFDNTNVNGALTASIGKSPLDTSFSVRNNLAAVNINIPKLNLSDVIPEKDKFKDTFGKIFTSVSLQYKGKIDEIEYDKVNFYAKILGAEPHNKLQISNGEVSLKNDKLSIKNIHGTFLNTKSVFDLNLNVDNITANPNINGSIKLRDFELSLINMFGEYTILPPKIRDAIKQVKFNKGKITLNAEIRNNNINASTNLGGVEFTYTPLNLPIKIVNGSVYTKRNYLGLNKINLLADGMPILIDGGINDIFTKQNFNLYINSKPKQDFVDKYINNNKIYPMKIKGDIVYQAKFNGTKDDFDISLQADMAKDSSIYYLGAIIGDVENALVVNLNMNVLQQHLLRIKEFSYDKLIASQGTRYTRMNMLKASGGIDIFNDDLDFHDLRIKTQNPTDVRIFNIIFRKPNIKQGQFTSDLKFNGKLSNPKIVGNFHLFETNIPFLDTSMKNITMQFRDKTIDISSLGEIMGNEIKIKGRLRNKLTAPYYIENAEIYTKEMDLNYITNKLKMSQVDDYRTFETFEGFNLRDLVIKNLKMTSNRIRLRNLVAQNVQANVFLNENNVLNIENFKFDVANGTLNGSFKYNVKNNQTGINLKAKDIDANAISYALFGLNNQIYGSLTGNINLTCNGEEFNKCMETLNGKTSFNVSEGRMPKLGSLEYLLRAGNLLKGGITNLSINSVIDIISPLKTGNFSSIYGEMEIKDGIAEDIEISTRGKDLSLFIAGKYNFATSVAEMEVLGMLSKKISTMFGPLGNVSLNTLFNVIPGVDLTKDSKILENINKIPGIELSGKAYRKFVSEIKGNINSDNYVTSFRWIN